jgi:DHA1 family tetracycline resistance protein-like MFS transporter
MNQPITGARRQAALGFIFVTAIMDVLSLGVMIPVLPNLVKQFGGGDTAVAADWNILFATTWGVMQFFCSPILGLMSDRWGRRPVILTSIFGLGVDFLFMAFAPSLWWLFVGRIFNGMTAASFSTASAYVADVTTPENRAKGFGLMGAAFGVGFTFGPAWAAGCGSSTIARRSWSARPWPCATGSMASSSCRSRCRPSAVSRASTGRRPIRSARCSCCNAPGPAGPGRRRLPVPAGPQRPAQRLRALYGLPLRLVAGDHRPDPDGQRHFQHHRPGRGRRPGGQGAGRARGAADRPVLGLRRLHDLRPGADRASLYLCGLPIFALSGLIQPGLQGLMTRRVAPNEQGQLQGANSAMMGIASIIGPPLFLCRSPSLSATTRPCTCRACRC